MAVRFLVGNGSSPDPTEGILTPHILQGNDGVIMAEGNGLVNEIVATYLLNGIILSGDEEKY